MYQWEKYKTYPHDHWWANFIRAARIRTEQLRTELGSDAKITWLVYRQGYEDRAKQEHQDLISLIGSVRDKLSLNLRSEEHTSELQSQSNLVCRLLLEKKKKKNISNIYVERQHDCNVCYVEY